MIGLLAFRGRAEDPRGAMAYTNDALGSPILFALAAGFLAYGAWRLFDAYADTEKRGVEPKALLLRLGRAGIGLIYFGFAYSAVRIALHDASVRRGAEARSGASMALGIPAGRFVVGAVAIAFVAAGIVQLWKAYDLGFLRKLSRRAAQSNVVKWCGRIGLFGRAMVFFGVALLLCRAAIQMNPGEAGGSGDALEAMPLWLRALAGAALILFGILSLIQATFREIERPSR
jgi:hypothetical protein